MTIRNAHRWLAGAALVACAAVGSAVAGTDSGRPSASGHAGATADAPMSKADLIKRGEEIHRRQVQEGPTAEPLPNGSGSCPQRGGSGTIFLLEHGSTLPGGGGYRTGAATSAADGAPLVIYAGTLEQNLVQGVIRVEKLARDLCAEVAEAGVESLIVGDRAGPVELVEVVGPHVTFRLVESGCQATYEVTTGPEVDVVGQLAVPECGPINDRVPVVATAAPPDAVARPRDGDR